MRLSTAWQTEERFTFVVGYEDADSRLRALELYKRLIASLSDGLDLRLILWKFEPLGIDALLARATNDAINADLILISLPGHHPLPPEAINWIARWGGRTVKETGLAVLFHPEYHDAPEAIRTVKLLEAVAQQNGAAFFSSAQESTDDCLPQQPNLSSEVEMLRAAFHPEDYMEHWGLNE